MEALMATTIDCECGPCSGTGLYKGFAEPEGTAVVCVKCKGTGCAPLTYTPFTGRKQRSGIRRVCLSKGTFIGAGVGPAGNSISYEEFYRGHMPG